MTFSFPDLAAGRPAARRGCAYVGVVCVKSVFCVCVVGACSVGLAAFGPRSPIPQPAFDLVFCPRARHTVYHPWLTGVGGGRPGAEVTFRPPSAPRQVRLPNKATIGNQTAPSEVHEQPVTPYGQQPRVRAPPIQWTYASTYFPSQLFNVEDLT